MEAVPPPLAHDAVLRIYERLASAVLAAARARGYGGDDVQAAAALLATPDPLVRKLCEAALALWQQQGASADDHLQAAVHSLGGGSCPPLRLAIELLEDLSSRQRQRRSTTVIHALDSDDHQRLTKLLAAALEEMGESMSEGDPAHRLLGQLVKRYRVILNQTNLQAEHHRRHLALLMVALQDVVSGNRPQRLEQLGDDALIVEGLWSMLDGRQALVERARAAEDALATHHSELARLRHQLGELQGEVQRLQSLGDEDQRLGAYREAFARIERGDDAQDLLEGIRDLERVIIASQATITETLRLLDRSLDNTVHCLQDLRRILPLGPDPKRYRPRFLGKSPYQLRTLPGMLAACRDAAQDVERFAKRVRWIEGLGGFAKRLNKLRPAMQEMVRLVADCRDKAGDRVTMSLTVNMATTAGLASLPLLLAGDLLSLARSRRGKSYCERLLPLCEDIVNEYQNALAKAVDDLPLCPESSKRERPAGAIRRLADHLVLLAEWQDRHFAEADIQDFQPSRADQLLLADRDLLRRGCSELAAMVEHCADLGGGPNRSELHIIPKLGKSDGAAWQRCAHSHAQWLADAARYRVQLLPDS
ncbi:MAG: hypothetical protein EA402_01685 [Planctomycetota bacterium]|nr:MAG: hypothetical protein EA402_01685 [Planctomycetota bacterium]